MQRRSFLLTLAALAAAHREAVAADPLFTQPLKIVVPASPGGFTDIASRLIGEKLALRIGQPVPIENKPGASGMIGAEAVARAAPDGSSIVMGNIQSHGANVGLFKKMPYDAIRDFAPVTRVAMGYNMLVVHPSSPVRTLPDLIDYAKKQTKPLSYGSGGSGSSSHLASEMLRQRAGIELLHVPYRATAPAVQALLAGQLAMLFDTVPSAISQVRAGALRAIAVTAPTRLPSLPELPTVAETLPGFEVAVWGGIYAPAGTPEKWIEALDREIQAVLKDPSVAQRFEQLGFAPLALGPKDFAAFTRAEIAKWSEVIRIGKITVD